MRRRVEIAPRRPARGIALVTAMLLAAILTAAAAALATDQYLEGRRLSNLVEGERAQLLVAALEQQARLLLARDAQRGRYDGGAEIWERTPLAEEYAGLAGEASLEDLQGRFNLTNLSPDPSQSPGGARQTAVAPPPAATAEGTPTPAPSPSRDPDDFVPEDPAQFREEDMPQGGPSLVAAEPGVRVGQTAVASPPPPSPRPGLTGERQLRLLFKALALDETPIQAILDWIDPDSETRFPNGAEDDYYTRLSPPYRTANRPMASPRELLLVRGVTPELLKALEAYVVCLPDMTPINVNTAPREVLMSLGPGIGSHIAEALIRTRETQPFLSTEAFLRHPLLQYSDIDRGGVASTSEYFELRSTVHSARYTQTVLSLLARVDLEVRRVARYPAPLPPLATEGRRDE